MKFTTKLDVFDMLMLRIRLESLEKRIPMLKHMKPEHFYEKGLLDETINDLENELTEIKHQLGDE